MLSCSNDTTTPPALVDARDRILGIVGPMILAAGATRGVLLEAVSACGWSAALSLEDATALDEIGAVLALLSCYSRSGCECEVQS